MSGSPRSTGESGFVGGWVSLLWRRRGWAASVFLLIVGLGLAMALLSRPVYMAESRLRLGEPPPMSGVSPNAGVLSFLRLGGDPFANDLELLSSRSLAESLVREVALTARLRSTRSVHRDSVLTSLAVGDSTIKATYEVTWTDPSTVQIAQTAPRDSSIGSFRVGSPADFGGVRAVFRPRESWGPESVRIQTVPFGEAVRPIPGRLTLTRTRREANVLTVSFADPDPAIAQQVVEAAVSTFLELRNDLMERESSETVDSLRTVARGTMAELEAAELAIEELQRTSGMFAPEVQSEALIGRYEETFAAMEAVRAERNALRSQLDRVAAATDRIDAWTTLVAHPRFLENLTVGDLLSRLTELEAERTRVASSRTDASRDVRAVESQILQLDAALRQIAREYSQALDQQVDDLEQRVGALDAELARLPSVALELGRRQRTARLLSELVIVTEQRLRQEELRLALSFSNVQVVDPPRLRYRPIWPRKKLVVAVALLLGVASSLVAVVVVERADGTVRSMTGSDLRLELPVLGVVGDPAPGASEALHAALRHVAAAPGAALGIAAVDASVRPEAVVESLGPILGPDNFVGASITGFGSAAALVVRAPSVVLVARPGRTARADLARAADWVEEAGGRVVGAVIVGPAVARG